LGAADPVAASTRPQKAWFKDWRAWVAIGGGIVLGAIIEHQYDDDGDRVTKHKTVYVTPPDGPPAFCWPPGRCR
jgi:hypothetical protein